MGKGYSLKMRAGSTEEADLFIYEDIGPSFFGGVSAKQVADDLKALGPVKVINVRINSYGGEVFDGIAIYTQLKAHSARIVVHIDGVAASIASVIAMAGDEIRISEAAFVMIHNPAGVCFGEAADMRQMADMLEKVRGSVIDVYVERTGMTAEALIPLLDAETWFTAQEALDHGFADEMVAHLHLAAAYDPAKHQFKRPPATLRAEAAAPAVQTLEPPASTPPAARQRFDAASRAVAANAARLASRRADNDLRTA